MNVEPKELGARLAAEPIRSRAGFIQRWRTMGRVALRMMFHDRLKMAGTLMGVVFAVLLSNQQAGTFLGLLYKNVMFVRNTNADVWITPASTMTFQPGKPLPNEALMVARTAPGVSWAEPILVGQVAINMADGGSEPIQLIGARYPYEHGGPWNVVAGDAKGLALPNAITFEDSERERLGGMNIGSVREMNGYRVRIAAMTWGLLPFGPAYSFADIEFARRVLRFGEDESSFVLVGVQDGRDAETVARELQALLPDAKVFTKPEFEWSIVLYILTRTPIGITFGTSALFGIIVGFVIVALSMFSAVVDNVREFGTFKALGATNGDLARILAVQSIVYALVGSVIGLFLVTRVAEGIRSPRLALVLPPELFAGTTLGMILMCLAASALALWRLRKVEPGMVFR